MTQPPQYVILFASHTLQESGVYLGEAQFAPDWDAAVTLARERLTDNVQIDSEDEDEDEMLLAASAFGDALPAKPRDFEVAYDNGSGSWCVRVQRIG